MGNNIIRTVFVSEECSEVVKQLPCYRITLPNGDIILDSDKMVVCCRNVAKSGDTLVEYENHKWEVIHPI